MTVPNAFFIFLLAFSSITGWLMLREPATISMADAGSALGTQAVEPKLSREALQQGSLPTTSEKVTTMSDGERYLRNKLNNLVIPLVDFQDTTLEEAMDFLRLRLRELSDEEPGGISLIIEHPKPYQAADGSLHMDSSNPPKTITIQARDMLLGDVIQEIAHQTDYQVVITDHGLRLVPIAQ